VIRHEIGVGAMMASVYLLSRALAPIDMAIGMWRQMVAAQASYGRLSLLLQVEESRPDGLKLPRPEGRLTVQNVVFGRPGLPPVLKGVSFAAAPGDIVGIVGPSAAGKSTLAKLLVGVWRPTSGVVRLDGADVTNWDPDDLGSHLGYLPQEVELFAGTVSDNISRMQPGLDAEVVAAAELSGAHDLILRLPKGYDTEIGEGGSVLSGGQRQRIGLARALFGDPTLVVLDEPNANLDGAGEDALIAAVKRAKESGCTVVLITHKPALLFAVDKILVLKNGIVSAFGDRKEILPKVLPNSPRPVAKVEGQRRAVQVEAQRG
ncbi:MAG: ATP-binding cassette domain-containing protein, partial [Hyphomicrobiales bacterium]|nr:ATP-binding cassette domain-containing protein [Hyphomicrobiales bacterium]